MSRRFDSGLLALATEEARLLGSRTVEAEHLLLALAADGDSPSGRLLAEAGLNPAGVRRALDLETERSLSAVGVSPRDLAVGRATPPRRSPRLGASLKRAIQQAGLFTVAHGSGEITAAHLLAGVLSAEIGTVPRALAAVAVDRSALLSRAGRMAATTAA